MTRTVAVVDARGERSLTLNDFPLSVGAGDADIQIPGITHEDAIAHIDLSGDAVFLEPTGDDFPVLLNDELLRESGWLKHGDELRVGPARILCEIRPQRLGFTLRSADTTGPTTHQERAAPPKRGIAPPVPNPTRRSSPLLVGAVCIVFAFMLFAAWFVFTAATVTVSISPAPDTLTLQGNSLQVRLADHYLLRPGEYRVVAEKSGYRRHEQVLAVNDRNPHRLSFMLEKLPGKLAITTQPADGVTVQLNEKTIDIASAVELPAGSHRIIARAPRYLESTRDIQIEGGGVEQKLVIELEPAWARVSFDSNPPGAQIDVDGRPIGTTPISTDLLAGPHRVEIRLDGYSTWQSSIAVTASQPLSIPRIELDTAKARITLRSRPAGAAVTMNGEFEGETPLELAVAPDAKHTIRLTRSGYQAATRTVTLAPDERKALLIKLIAIPEPARTTEAPKTNAVTTASIGTKPAPTAPARAANAETITTVEGQVLRRIRPGRFTMGASRREQGRRANETLREVVLTRPFYLGVKEVTNREFRRFTAAHSSGRFGGQSLNADDQPVANLSWEQAARYCNWLSAKESLPPAYVEKNGKLTAADPPTLGYRLPTEAEWAWAARFAGGGEATKYAWGSGFPPSGSAGNYAEQSASTILADTLPTYDDSYAAAAPVGRFAANALGLYDLGGNVAEWCHDYYGVYSASAGNTATDPMGPREGRHRVVRGSSWQDAGIGPLRLSYRDYSDDKRADLGFRIARYGG